MNIDRNLLNGMDMSKAKMCSVVLIFWMWPRLRGATPDDFDFTILGNCKTHLLEIFLPHPGLVARSTLFRGIISQVNVLTPVCL